MTTIIVLGVIVVAILWIVGAYNKFIKLINRAKEAWSDIEVQLKRRYDLIPNLISTVKGYASHEAGTLQKVTEARTAAMGAQSVEEHAQAENMLTGALKSVFALSEGYPDLKASENFVELQKELSDTENKIQASRRFYNTNVRDLNIGVQSFPGSIIANVFKFEEMNLFELSEDEREVAEKAPEVKF